MVPPPHSTSASTLCRLWRYTIINFETTGSPFTSTALCWLFGPLSSTLPTNNPAIHYWSAFILFHDTQANADTRLTTSRTSLVGRFIPWVVWLATISSILSCNIFGLYPEWKIISDQMGSSAKALENTSTLDCNLASLSVCPFTLTVEKMKPYVRFIFGTKKWAFMLGPHLGSNRPCQTLASIMSFSMCMTFFGLWNILFFQNLSLDSCRI